MRADEEQTLGGGLEAGIFAVPWLFGWVALRSGYHPLVRIAVATWMAVSLVPLWMLFSILWGSGDDVKTMARDFDRNRAVAMRNAGTAQGYIKDYDAGDVSGAPKSIGAMQTEADAGIPTPAPSPASRSMP